MISLIMKCRCSQPVIMCLLDEKANKMLTGLDHQVVLNDASFELIIFSIFTGALFLYLHC